MNITKIANAVEIKNQNITDLWKEKTLRYGFLATPNTLIFYVSRLNLTGNEFRLIITVFALHSLGKQAIKDREIASHSNIDVNGKRFFYERRSLEAKGYLKTTVKKTYEAGQYKTKGVIYDFTGLIEKICELVDEDENQKKSKQENKNQNSTTPSTDKEKKETQTKNETQNKYDELILKNFLSAYCKMHKELLNIELNFYKKTKQKEYVVKIYETIEAKKVDYKDVLEKAKSLFEKLGDIGKTSLAFQDTVARAVAFTTNKKTTASSTTKKSIPSVDSLFGKNKK